MTIRLGAALSRASAAVAAVAAMALALAGCRRATDVAPPPQVEATVGVPEATAVLAGPLPTWTLGAPLGDGPSATAGVPVADVAPGAGGTPGSVSAPEGVPAPTVRPPAAVGAAGPPPTDPAIVSLMGAVSADRLRADVATLAGFGTRHVLSSPEGGSRGIGPARAWLGAAFEAIGRGATSQLVVDAEPFTLTFAGRSTEQHNVVATLTGIGATKRFVYVVAHYDSRAAAVDDGATDAPGAADNATGTAALLELARVLGRRQWDATIRLLATAAGEPGQYGAKHHAAHARALGLGIVAVLDNDVIGGPPGAGAPLRAVAPGDDGGAARRLARLADVIAGRYAEHARGPAGPIAVEPVASDDRDGGAGDDRAFGDAGYAAVRLTAGGVDPGRLHGPSDRPDGLDPTAHAAVVRLNVALAANLALAPVGEVATPRLVAESSPPGRLRVSWDPLADPSVAGYVVAWRRAGEARYAQTQWSPTTEAVLDGLPTDAELRVAVAAADDLGHIGLFGPEGSR